MSSCPSEISVVVDCSQPVLATVEVGGIPGASAYDIWLQQPGNAGKTIEEYLDDLRGLQGKIGPGGYPVALTDIAPGDLLRLSVESAWVNVRPQVLTDGGNF